MRALQRRVSISLEKVRRLPLDTLLLPRASKSGLEDRAQGSLCWHPRRDLATEVYSYMSAVRSDHRAVLAIVEMPFVRRTAQEDGCSSRIEVGTCVCHGRKRQRILSPSLHVFERRWGTHSLLTSTHELGAWVAHMCVPIGSAVLRSRNSDYV